MMRKRKLYRQVMVMSLATALAAGSAVTAFAGQWEQDEKGWRFQTGENAYHTNGWQWLDSNGDGISECYYFNPDGYMAAATTTPDGYTVNADGAWTENGTVRTRDDRITVPDGAWVQGTGADAGKWWWKNTDGSCPKDGWTWLDGNNDGMAECYYFDADGWCVMNGMTPDGYTVNADGAWAAGADSVRRPARHGSAGTSGSSISTGSAGKSSGSTGGGGGSSHSGGGGSSSSTRYVHDENYGNLGQMSSSEWAETKDAILAFKEENLTSDMTDFEKEMKIIQWLCENCVYGVADDWSRATAYSCIVGGQAQCDGYADAFLQTARLCGLTVKFVLLPNHAINLIKLDGKWYWVDVTEADTEARSTMIPGSTSGGSIPVGSAFIECAAVNMNDTQVEALWGDKGKYSLNMKCTATKYGWKAAYDYYKYGLVPGRSEQKTEEEDENVENMIKSYKADGKLLVEYTTTDDAVAEIMEYLSDRIDHKKNDYGICVVFADEAEAKNASGIANKVNRQISEKYHDGALHWSAGMKFTLPEENYYTTKKLAYTDAAISYQKNAIGYTIRFVYNGREISSVSGTAKVNQVIKGYKIPKGYEMEDVEVTEGEGAVLGGGTILSASEDDTVFTVTLKKAGDDAES